MGAHFLFVAPLVSGKKMRSGGVYGCTVCGLRFCFSGGRSWDLPGSTAPPPRAAREEEVRPPLERIGSQFAQMSDL